jgi:catechol 2,3-dioxygenase-like lactoylglutathione lyase family enzyme
VFDGIDILTLPAADVGALERLYVEGFGFRVERVEALADPGWAKLWSLPDLPRRAVVVGKPGSRGGWIRLAEVPGLAAARPAGRPDRDGPYALDFYVRDPDRVEERIRALGWNFRSEPQRYLLPGTRTVVRERMLEQPESGLLHAVVEYRPGETRCVLADAVDQDCSEVVAAVFFTHHLAAATDFAEQILGARRYFAGRFDGDAVERMLGLAPGEGFDAALFRGRTSRNARLEFAQTMTTSGAEGASARPTTAPDAVPRVIAGCATDDLDGLADRLADGVYGVSTGVITVDGRRRLGLRSAFGAAFEFWERQHASPSAALQSSRFRLS